MTRPNSPNPQECQLSGVTSDPQMDEYQSTGDECHDEQGQYENMSREEGADATIAR